MKKTLLGAAALALLLSLTGCTGRGTTDRYNAMTNDQSYTADQAGRTNEAGDNGIITGSNSTATNGTTKDTTDRNRDGVPDTNTAQDGSSAAARDVRRAVDSAGRAVDDAAQGAATSWTTPRMSSPAKRTAHTAGARSAEPQGRAACRSSHFTSISSAFSHFYH